VEIPNFRPDKGNLRSRIVARRQCRLTMISLCSSGDHHRRPTLTEPDEAIIYRDKFVL